jgi:hypothetical protein
LTSSSRTYLAGPQAWAAGRAHARGFVVCGTPDDPAGGRGPTSQLTAPSSQLGRILFFAADRPVQYLARVFLATLPSSGAQEVVRAFMLPTSIFS